MVFNKFYCYLIMIFLKGAAQCRPKMEWIRIVLQALQFPAQLLSCIRMQVSYD